MIGVLEETSIGPAPRSRVTLTLKVQNHKGIIKLAFLGILLETSKRCMAYCQFISYNIGQLFRHYEI